MAPHQSLVLPVALIQHKPYFEASLTIKIVFKSKGHPTYVSGPRTLTLDAKLSLSHRTFWEIGKDEIVYKACYSLGQMPLYFMVKPPQRKSASSPVIIALRGSLSPLISVLVLSISADGAGVETSSPFWTDAVKRQPTSWIIFPTGRTSWVSQVPLDPSNDLLLIRALTGMGRAH